MVDYKYAGAFTIPHRISFGSSIYQVAGRNAFSVLRRRFDHR